MMLIVIELRLYLIVE